MPTMHPRFRDLSRDEIEAILTRNHIGRLAYAFHDRVGIVPLHYVYAHGWIYGRTAHGGKLDAITHHRWVAFEVDEVDAPFDWRSVVVHGAIYFLPPDPNEEELHAFAHGIDLLRRAFPGTLRADDPTPFRNVIFRIHLDETTGRESSTRT